MKARTVALSSVVLLAALAVLVNIALAQGPQLAKEAPPGANVVKAFSKPDAACKQLTDWVVAASTKDWIDAGIEWIAVDQATAQNNWKNLSYVITVDGQKVANPNAYEQGPAPAKVECPDFTVEGGSMALKIYVPPLPAGDHKVTWQVILDATINDGWGDYPKGTVSAFTSTVRVAPATLPETGGSADLLANWLILAGGLALLGGLGLALKKR
jgi:hypothetical protein